MSHGKLSFGDGYPPRTPARRGGSVGGSVVIGKSVYDELDELTQSNDALLGYVRRLREGEGGGVAPQSPAFELDELRSSYASELEAELRLTSTELHVVVRRNAALRRALVKLALDRHEALLTCRDAQLASTSAARCFVLGSALSRWRRVAVRYARAEADEARRASILDRRVRAAATRASRLSLGKWRSATVETSYGSGRPTAKKCLTTTLTQTTPKRTTLTAPMLTTPTTPTAKRTTTLPTQTMPTSRLPRRGSAADALLKRSLVRLLTDRAVRRAWANWRVGAARKAAHRAAKGSLIKALTAQVRTLSTVDDLLCAANILAAVVASDDGGEEEGAL